MSEDNTQYVLTVLDPPAQGKQFVIPDNMSTIHIGRSVDNDIPIDLPSISRHHAVLHRERNRFRITDAGSRNGLAVDGRETRDSFLVPGCVISVGDVNLRLDIAGADAQSTLETSQREDARPVAQRTAEVRTVGMPGEVQSEEEAQPPKAPPARTLRTAILMIVLAGAILGPALVGRGVLLRAARPRVLKLDPVLVRVNENRLISSSQVVRMGGRKIRVTPDFVESSIRIEDDDIAQLAKFEERLMVVRGRSSGSTRATMRTLKGSLVTLHIIVRGSLPDPLESYRRLPNDLDIRRPIAEQHIAAGNRVAKTKPYAALQEYRIALEIMAPHNAHQPYGLARRRVTEMEAKVDELFNALRGTLRQSAETGEISNYEESIQAILELIPDENDPRRQYAISLRQRLIRMMEQRKKKR